MKRFIIILLGFTVIIGMASCNRTQPPVDDQQQQEENGINDTADLTSADTSDDQIKMEDDKAIAGYTGEADDEDNAVEDTEENKDYEVTEDGIIAPADAERIIKDISDAVINALKKKDVETLSAHIHPEKGVLFSPYTFVYKGDAITFGWDEIKNFFKDEKAYIWGYYAGHGKVINLIPRDYYKEFVYNRDFVNADKIGYNTVLSSGDTLNNHFDVFKNPILVEYYFTGFDPENEGKDWESLSLAFEEHEGSWYLVGIIHNQMTA